MNYKVTLLISGANSREEAYNAVDAMLDAYEFYCRKVEDDPSDSDPEIFVPEDVELLDADQL